MKIIILYEQNIQSIGNVIMCCYTLYHIVSYHSIFNNMQYYVVIHYNSICISLNIEWEDTIWYDILQHKITL